jgi:hypothetical protein
MSVISLDDLVLKIVTPGSADILSAVRSVLNMKERGVIVRVSGRMKIAQPFKAGLTMNIENKSRL